MSMNRLDRRNSDSTSSLFRQRPKLPQLSSSHQSRLGTFASCQNLANDNSSSGRLLKRPQSASSLTHSCEELNTLMKKLDANIPSNTSSQETVCGDKYRDDVKKEMLEITPDGCHIIIQSPSDEELSDFCIMLSSRTFKTSSLTKGKVKPEDIIPNFPSLDIQDLSSDCSSSVSSSFKTFTSKIEIDYSPKLTKKPDINQALFSKDAILSGPRKWHSMDMRRLRRKLSDCEYDLSEWKQNSVESPSHVELEREFSFTSNPNIRDNFSLPNRKSSQTSQLTSSILSQKRTSPAESYPYNTVSLKSRSTDATTSSSQNNKFSNITTSFDSMLPSSKSNLPSSSDVSMNLAIDTNISPLSSTSSFAKPHRSQSQKNSPTVHFQLNPRDRKHRKVKEKPRKEGNSESSMDSLEGSPFSSNGSLSYQPHSKKIVNRSNSTPVRLPNLDTAHALKGSIQEQFNLIAKLNQTRKESDQYRQSPNLTPIYSSTLVVGSNSDISSNETTDKELTDDIHQILPQFKNQRNRKKKDFLNNYEAFDRTKELNDQNIKEVKENINFISKKCEESIKSQAFNLRGMEERFVSKEEKLKFNFRLSSDTQNSNFEREIIQQPNCKSESEAVNFMVAANTKDIRSDGTTSSPADKSTIDEEVDSSGESASVVNQTSLFNGEVSRKDVNSKSRLQTAEVTELNEYLAAEMDNEINDHTYSNSSLQFWESARVLPDGVRNTLPSIQVLQDTSCELISVNEVTTSITTPVYFNSDHVNTSLIYKQANRSENNSKEKYDNCSKVNMKSLKLEGSNLLKKIANTFNTSGNKSAPNDGSDYDDFVELLDSNYEESSDEEDNWGNMLVSNYSKNKCPEDDRVSLSSLLEPTITREDKVAESSGDGVTYIEMQEMKSVRYVNIHQNSSPHPPSESSPSDHINNLHTTSQDSSPSIIDTQDSPLTVKTISCSKYADSPNLTLIPECDENIVTDLDEF